jgi:hypothetical protein
VATCDGSMMMRRPAIGTSSDSRCPSRRAGNLRFATGASSGGFGARAPRYWLHTRRVNKVVGGHFQQLRVRADSSHVVPLRGRGAFPSAITPPPNSPSPEAARNTSYTEDEDSGAAVDEHQLLDYGQGVRVGMTPRDRASHLDILAAHVTEEDLVRFGPAPFPASVAITKALWRATARAHCNNQFRT